MGHFAGAALADRVNVDIAANCSLSINRSRVVERKDRSQVGVL